MAKTVRLVGAMLAALALATGAAGCGSDSATAPATGGAGASASSAPASAAAPAGKVSANNASEDELTVAFEQAGVPNAEKWADEVTEYRPYPADDPNFGKLRTELAKYNPAPGVVDKIVSVLQP